jgi:hypothetical protein
MEVKQSTLGAYQQAPPASPELTTTPPVAPAETVAIEAITTDTPPAEAPLATEAATTPSEAPTQEQQQQDAVVAFDMPAYEQEAASAQEATQQQATDWREALKANREEALATLGLDPFVIELNQHIQNGGSAEDYLSAKAVDWNKVPDADLLKKGLKAEFPSASQAQIDRLFNKKYSQHDLAEEEDKEDGLLLIEADARKARQREIEHQQKFQIRQATPTPQAQPQEDPAVEKAQQENIEFFNKLIQSEQTKALFQSKRVAIDLGEGVKPVQVSIPHPQQLLDALLKPDLAKRFGRTPQGEPDVQQWQELALFLSNPKQYKQVIRNSAKESAKRDLVDEGHNAQKPTSVIPMHGNQYASVGEAIAGGNIKVGTLGSHR